MALPRERVRSMSSAARRLRADALADRLLERLVLELMDQRFEEALAITRTACGRVSPRRDCM